MRKSTVSSINEENVCMLQILKKKDSPESENEFFDLQKTD